MIARRRGTTLIETIVFVTTVTVVLALATTLLHRMLRLDRAERARVVAVASIERLGLALRDDARIASGPIERADARLVVPMGGGRSVAYEIREADVLRTVTDAGKVRAFEAYKRPAGTVAAFAKPGAGEAGLIVLRLDLAADRPGDPVYRGFEIVAATHAKGVTP